MESNLTSYEVMKVDTEASLEKHDYMKNSEAKTGQRKAGEEDCGGGKDWKIKTREKIGVSKENSRGRKGQRNQGKTFETRNSADII